jgi:hypothetical protein
MRTTLRNAALLAAILLCVACAVFLINQTVQAVALADRVHPALGTSVLWGLLALYAVCVTVPVVMFLRLPKPLTPPPTEESPGFQEHLTALGRRLRENRLLAGRAVSSREEIREALRILDGRADEIIRQSGSQVFIATAVSQNGSLDGLMVLLAQSRMIWRIAHVYLQRPTPRDLISLYANVTSTALVASQLDDLDLSEQAQPLVSAVVGSFAGAIPGLQAASTLLVTSIATGTANAFLVLRVGILARTYCGAVTLPETRTLRRMAAAQAAQMLGTIARDGARRVATAFWNATATRASEAARGFRDSVTQGVKMMVQRRSTPEKAPDAPQTGPHLIP